MREEKIFVNGILTNYKISGQGENFLILHGWGGSSDSWKKVIEILEKKFKVICPDIPGFGKSQAPQTPWSLNDFVKWLKNFADNLKLENFYLLGHSFGGRIAIKFSALFPERVKTLFLVASAGIKMKWGLKEKITFQLSRIGNFIFSKRPFLYLKDTAQNLFYWILRVKDYSKAKGVMKETMKKIIDEDLFPELEKIQTKTVIVWGEKDKILPLKFAFLFKEKIKNSKLKIMKKVGHRLQLEDPETLSKILIENSC